MLYKFKSKAAGDVIMTGPAGDQIVRILGKEPAPQEQAVLDEEAERKRAEEEAQAEGRTLPPREGVTLRQRAWPLVEMMRRAHEADKEIVWGV